MFEAKEIERLIATGLTCEQLQVQGDGHHFEALVVSAAFEGKRLIQRHQMVNKTLGALMGNEIHALSMKTMTPAEYQHGQA